MEQEAAHEATPSSDSYPVEMLSIGQIEIPPTARELSDNLDILQASIANVGLLHPITVRKKQNAEGYELISGQHRLEAAKNLGWTTIPAHVLEYPDNNDLLQELAVLDENLCRADLRQLEYAEALGRAKEIYEELYPETRHGKKGKNKDPESGSSSLKHPAFIDDEARRISWSRTKVGKYLTIHNKLQDDVKEKLRHHDAGNSLTILEDLARRPANEQQAIVTALVQSSKIKYVDAVKDAAQKLRADGQEAFKQYLDDEQGIDEERYHHIQKEMKKRGVLTLKYALQELMDAAKRLQQGGEQACEVTCSHNTLTIQFKGFATPSKLKNKLPAECPGWGLFHPEEAVCKGCVSHKACLKAQILDQDKQLTQLPLRKYRHMTKNGESADPTEASEAESKAARETPSA